MVSKLAVVGNVDRDNQARSMQAYRSSKLVLGFDSLCAWENRSDFFIQVFALQSSLICFEQYLTNHPSPFPKDGHIDAFQYSNNFVVKHVYSLCFLCSCRRETSASL